MDRSSNSRRCGELGSSNLADVPTVLKMGYKPGVHAEFDAAGRMVRVIEGEPTEVSEPLSAAATGQEVRHG